MEPLSRRDLLCGAAASAAVLSAGDASGASELPTRILGRTGVRVPILGYGTAPTGLRRNLEDALALYREALELGVTYFDTAPNHTGYGQAQVQLGHFLKEHRRQVFLVTKTFESEGDKALALLQKNLQELQTERADLVYAHSLGSLDLATATGPRGVFQALLKAKKDGLTRFVGVSGHHLPGRFLPVLRDFDLDVVMNAVNFVDRHTYNFEGSVWPEARRRNLGLVAMKVFGGMKPGAREASNSMLPPDRHELALRYALSQEGVSLAIVGMATREELRQNVERARRFQPLTAAETAELEAAGKRLAAEWGPHFGPAA